MLLSTHWNSSNRRLSTASDGEDTEKLDSLNVAGHNVEHYSHLLNNFVLFKS